MITAKEALRLPRATITPDEAREIADMLEDLEEFIREHMTFSGLAGDSSPRFLCPDIRVLGGITNVCRSRISTDAVAKAVCLKMSAVGWNCNVNLMSVPSRVGNGVQPHHWVFVLLPRAEEYSDDMFPPPPSRLS